MHLDFNKLTNEQIDLIVFRISKKFDDNTIELENFSKIISNYRKKRYDSGRRPLFTKYSFPQRYEGLQAWNRNRILFLRKATFWEQEGALKVKNKIGEKNFFLNQQQGWKI